MPIFTGTATQAGLNSFFAVMTNSADEAEHRAKSSGLKDIEVKNVADFPQKAEDEIAASPGTVFIVNREEETWRRA